MKTKNAMQLKARINMKAKEAGIPSQALMQNYLLERLLVRLSNSKWQENVVIKGGMIISSLVGVASRTTMDLDTTVQGFDLTHESAESVFSEVAALASDDDWTFIFTRTESIRESDEYPGIRVYLLAKYPPIEIPLTIDVTTGDRITPAPIEYEYPLLFDEGSISLMAYTLETVLAEKLETIVSRGVTNTRPRDFYDIHLLWRLRREECNLVILGKAIDATCSKRGSEARMTHWNQVLHEVKQDVKMSELWNKYTKKNPYATGITLQECCDTAREILECTRNLQHG